ncbi:hypothetical protein [Actinoplanes siamensis]|uniref:Uncharacterized protein n=1 Tax=Actinoplanes siamensis TaxID=1223317 RepID=A0A919N9Q5_9ACTN|nr:hypothetical protein [Actinoplanes siamensis]GIF06840.1 hypothetical protein Asi03nite_43780 [Actinoplanes siamensis]
MSPVLLALLAAGLALPAPPLRFDPSTDTGFVPGAAVRKAFGWSEAVLAAKARGVEFSRGFWTVEKYAATCGGREYPLAYQSEFGRMMLTDQVVRGRGGSLGFRITGSHAGISGVALPWPIGSDCPGHPGLTITRLRLVSTGKGWALTAESGEASRPLLAGGEPATPGPG